MGQGSLINSKNHNNSLLNQDEASSARQQQYETSVKQFLDAKKKEFEEKFKNNGVSKNPVNKEGTGKELLCHFCVLLNHIFDPLTKF